MLSGPTGPEQQKTSSKPVTKINWRLLFETYQTLPKNECPSLSQQKKNESCPSANLSPRPWSTHGTAIIPVFMEWPPSIKKSWPQKCHWMRSTKCAMVKSRYIGDGHPTFNRNPYNGYINPYYWVDDHPLLYGNNGSLDPGTKWSHQNIKNSREFAGIPQTHSWALPKGSRKSHLQKLARPWVKLKLLRHFAKSAFNKNTTHDSLLFSKALVNSTMTPGH